MAKMIDTIGFHLYDKWLRNLRNGKNIERFFYDNFYVNIAIYGMGLMGKQVLEELKNSDVQVRYGIDQNAERMIVEGVDLILPDLLKDISQRIDVIVVTPMQYFYEIENLLLELADGTDIVSIEQIVEYVSRHG